MNAQLKPAVIIASERYSDELIAEMSPLLYEHWQEIATFKDKIPLDPDFPRYQKLDELGKILCLTARSDGNLIGYSVFVNQYPGHYKSTLSGLNDVIWVHPDHRRGRVGLLLIRQTEDALRTMGVKKMTWHAKPDTQLHALLLKLSYVVDEIMLAKLL